MAESTFTSSLRLGIFTDPGRRRSRQDSPMIHAQASDPVPSESVGDVPSANGDAKRGKWFTTFPTRVVKGEE